MQTATTFWTGATAQIAAPPKQTISGADCPLCNGTGTVVYMERYAWKARPGFSEAVEVLESITIPADAVRCQVLEQYPWPIWMETAGLCVCQEPLIAQRRMATLFGQPGVPLDCLDYTFADFPSPSWQLAVEMAEAFVTHDSLLDESGVERTGLLLSGSPGIGKTTLGSIVYARRMKAGQRGVWIKFLDLENKIRATYREDYEGPTANELRDAIQYAQFLLVDDLGSATRDKAYAEDMIEFMFLVFDTRLSKRLPTLVTTNLGPDALMRQFGAPVTSRLAGLCHAVALAGQDLRRVRPTVDDD